MEELLFIKVGYLLVSVAVLPIIISMIGDDFIPEYWDRLLRIACISLLSCGISMFVIQFSMFVIQFLII